MVEKNFAAVDHALAHLEKVELPAAATSSFDLTGAFSAKAPKFVHDVLGKIAEGKGDLIPVSAFPAGGAFPSGTAQWEKRNIAQFIPVWDKDLCIQCGKCVMVCPHAVIRAKIYSPELARQGAGDVQVGQAQVEGHGRPALHAAGGAGRLHRLRGVRGSLPGEEQERRQQEGHQHGAAGSAARAGTRELGFLPLAARSGPRPSSRTHK